MCKKSLISLICFGCVGVKQSRASSSSVAFVIRRARRDPSHIHRPRRVPVRLHARRDAPPPDRSHRSRAPKRIPPIHPVRSPSSRPPPRVIHASRSIHPSTGSPNDASIHARPVSPRLHRERPDARVPASPSHRIVPSSRTHHGQIADRRKETARASRRLFSPRLASPLVVASSTGSTSVSSLLHERPVLTHQSRTHHHTIPRRCPSPYTPHPIPHATVQKMEPHDIKTSLDV